MTQHICVTKKDLNGEEPIWVNKEGKEYWCGCEISDIHLLNIIAFLERKELPAYPMFQGEMAQELAERDYDAAENALFGTLQTMRDIAKSRGLV